MPESGGKSRLVVSLAAQQDIVEILRWSVNNFGERAAERYKVLLKQAFRDITSDPECPGSQDMPELAKGIRSYHLCHSRDRSRTSRGIVREPRHFVIYRCRQNVIDIVRILHDARELSRHLP